MIRSSFVCVIAAGLLSAPALTQQAPARTPLLTYVRVGAHRIAFASDTFVIRRRRTAVVASSLADLQAALGRAASYSTGDASTSMRLVCYQLRGHPAMTLVFESGEMGGGTWLTGFDFVPAGSRPELEHRCRPIETPSDSVVTNRGLQLGVTRAQVDAFLSLSGRDSAGFVLYESSIDTTAVVNGKRESCALGSSFRLRFDAGRLAAIKGSRVDAC
jgi:hypothetical protein